MFSSKGYRASCLLVIVNGIAVSNAFTPHNFARGNRIRTAKFGNDVSLQAKPDNISDFESNVMKGIAGFFLSAGAAAQMAFASPDMAQTTMLDGAPTVPSISREATSVVSSDMLLSAGAPSSGGGSSFDTLDFSLPSYGDATSKGGDAPKSAPSFSNPFPDLKLPEPNTEDSAKAKEEEAAAAAKAKEEAAIAAAKEKEAKAQAAADAKAKKEAEAQAKAEAKEKAAAEKAEAAEKAKAEAEAKAKRRAEEKEKQAEAVRKSIEAKKSEDSAPSTPSLGDVKLPSFEAPKLDIPKFEAPKIEAPKVDIPKFEAPKFDAPKFEAPKFDTPKIDVPKFDAPKFDAPKFDTPKIDVPKFDAPKFDTPKIDVPKFDAPKFDTPKFDAPKFDVPKFDAPKFETPSLPVKSGTSTSTAAPEKSEEDLGLDENGVSQEVRDEKARETRAEFLALDATAKEKEKAAKEARKLATDAKKVAKTAKGEACKTRWGGKILCIRPFGIGY